MIEYFKYTTVAVCVLYAALQHSATHCNTLQHTATCCNTLYFCCSVCAVRYTATLCNTLQCTATHCSTLQHAVLPLQCVCYMGHCNTLQSVSVCVALRHAFITSSKFGHTIFTKRLPNVLQCVLQCMLQCVLQCMLQCVLRCVAFPYFPQIQTYHLNENDQSPATHCTTLQPNEPHCTTQTLQLTPPPGPHQNDSHMPP